MPSRPASPPITSTGAGNPLPSPLPPIQHDEPADGASAEATVLRRRLADLESRLKAAEAASAKRAEADAKALAAEHEARRQCVAGEKQPEGSQCSIPQLAPSTCTHHPLAG